jgi:hypothetical protein
MDRRESSEGVTYRKELENDQAENGEYEEYVEENGAKFRIPYKKLKQVVFSGIRKDELIDIEHSARLQYRLMLLEPVLFAKVEFVTKRITLTYNPLDAESRKEKMSLQQIVDFLAKEGVHIQPQEMQEREVDYYSEIYKSHFSPQTIREHAPYGYTLQEWRKMKPAYEASKGTFEKKKLEKFHAWQREYLGTHPELAQQLGVKIGGGKPHSSTGKVPKGKKDEGEEGFWFYGA